MRPLQANLHLFLVFGSSTLHELIKKAAFLGKGIISSWFHAGLRPLQHVLNPFIAKKTDLSLIFMVFIALLKTMKTMKINDLLSMNINMALKSMKTEK